MLGAVQVTLDCPDQAAAIAVRDAIINYVAGLPAQAAHKYEPPVVHPKGSKWRVNAGIWYVDLQQAKNVFDRVQVIWGNPTYDPKILPGSWVMWHECREDEGDLDCSDNPQGIATKG